MDIFAYFYSFITFFLCLGVITCQSKVVQKSFQLSFPLENHSAYARLLNTISAPTQEFTICHWTRIRNVTNFGAIFSYATAEHNNELLSSILSNGQYRVYHREHISITNSSAPFKKWVHLCTTWSAYNQEFHSFKNGREVTGLREEGVPHENPILPGGIVFIGQDQDTLGGSLDPKQSFNGDISEVHLWDHILCPEQISHLAQCQAGDLEGNVISWSKSFFTFNGPVVMSEVTLCQENC